MKILAKNKERLLRDNTQIKNAQRKIKRPILYYIMKVVSKFFVIIAMLKIWRLQQKIKIEVPIRKQ